VTDRSYSRYRSDTDVNQSITFTCTVDPIGRGPSYLYSASHLQLILEPALYIIKTDDVHIRQHYFYYEFENITRRTTNNTRATVRVHEKSNNKRVTPHL